MPLWLLQPFPVPFPAPSWIGFMTTNGLLGALILLLGWVFPPLRVALGVRVLLRTPWLWLAFYLLWSLSGLSILALWGQLAQLLIGFLWSSMYIILLRFILLSLANSRI